VQPQSLEVARVAGPRVRLSRRLICVGCIDPAPMPHSGIAG
jgi:hypothetical protein